MAVAFDAGSESHTGTTGSTSAASFSWTHTPVGSPAGLLVFTFVNANADNALAVNWGGVALSPVPGGRAVDTAGEPGDCKAWFVGQGLTGRVGNSVTVTRTNNTNAMYAVAISVTAAQNTEVHVPGIVLVQGDGTLSEQSVTDGSPGVNSLRFAGCNSGLAAIIDNPGTPGTSLSRGTNSTEVANIDFGSRVIQVVRETTAGQGSRSVGFSATTSDDCAAVHLAVYEVAAAPTAFLSVAPDRVPAAARALALRLGALTEDLNWDVIGVASARYPSQFPPVSRHGQRGQTPIPVEPPPAPPAVPDLVEAVWFDGRGPTLARVAQTVLTASWARDLVLLTPPSDETVALPRRVVLGVAAASDRVEVTPPPTLPDLAWHGDAPDRVWRAARVALPPSLSEDLNWDLIALASARYPGPQAVRPRLPGIAVGPVDPVAAPAVVILPAVVLPPGVPGGIADATIQYQALGTPVPTSLDTLFTAAWQGAPIVPWRIVGRVAGTGVIAPEPIPPVVVPTVAGWTPTPVLILRRTPWGLAPTLAYAPLPIVAAAAPEQWYGAAPDQPPRRRGPTVALLARGVVGAAGFDPSATARPAFGGVGMQGWRVLQYPGMIVVFSEPAAVPALDGWAPRYPDGVDWLDWSAEPSGWLAEDV